LLQKYILTQLSDCTTTGWCVVFIFQKVGKLAATALGGGFLPFQLVNHTGSIRVDWQRVEKDTGESQGKERRKKPQVKSKAEELVSFVKKNVLATGGFFGAFLLGRAS
uniref:FUN14 domain-containing protein 2 n=1 Tax=Bos indicus x Bos taurus TaxID=30522 RepID=A0A4W2CQ75_BOBOX